MATGKTEKRDARKKESKKKGSNIKITLVVVLTLFLIISTILLWWYLYKPSLADPDMHYHYCLGISVNDASYNATDDKLDPGEDIVELRHMTGNKINWSGLKKITCRIVEQKQEFRLYVKSINGIEITNSTINATSIPGDSIILSLGSGSIPVGSKIIILIYTDPYYYLSPSAGLSVY